MWSGVADVAKLHLPHISSLVICQITKFTFPERRWPRTFQRNGMDGVEGCISSAWAKSGCYGPISLSFVNPRSKRTSVKNFFNTPSTPSSTLNFFTLSGTNPFANSTSAPLFRSPL